jgi:hypothetical protein
MSRTITQAAYIAAMAATVWTTTSGSGQADYCA